MADAPIPRTMKALIKQTETESYKYVEDMAVPEPEGDEVLIKVDSVSICGSDIALYHWNSVARVIASVPFIPGHEAAGTVVKCGPEAKLPLGTKVGVENHFYCGSCYQCTHDLREICSNMGQYGLGRKTMQGGCSEYSIVSAKYLYEITSGISCQSVSSVRMFFIEAAEEIAMLEPLGVAHNGMERLKVKDEDVLVIGCGPVGLLAQSVARVLGAKRVIAADIEDWKLDLAKEMGADVVINTKSKDIKQAIMELTDGVGVGRICECSGNSTMINTIFTYLRKGGRTVLIGIPRQPIHVENPFPDVLLKVLTLKTVHGRRIFQTWRDVENLVAKRQVDVMKVVSHRIPMSNFEEAFKLLFSGTACKIIMDPSS